MISSHDINNPDAYQRPVFSFGNKVKRYLFMLSWTLLCRWTPNPLHAWRVLILKLFGAKMGKTNYVYPNCRIWAPWLLETEDIVTIGPGVEIYNPGGVFLGHHVILSQDAFLCGATHDYNSIEFTYVMKKIVLDPYVWICAKSIVLPGVHGFEGSVLGAASIVSRHMEPWSVYAGNPAKLLKKRTNFLAGDKSANA
jgi:putative colanic acid biosynthesis acetyltransferase WcaF